jgi:hypothetical protein
MRDIRISRISVGKGGLFSQEIPDTFGDKATPIVLN